MKKSSQMKKIALVSALGLVLVGCGSGSNNTTDSNIKPQAMHGTIDSVSGNSVTVNGHSYNVGSVHYSDVSLSVSDLKPNMMVEISPATTARMASRSDGEVQVQINPTITGLITDINRTTGTFKVNGIELSFLALSEEINNNDWVMVSSLPTVGASYNVLSVVKFEQADLVGYVEVEGAIHNLDKNNFNFALGLSLNVDYAGAVIEDNALLENGLWVEVTGSMDNGTLTAIEVEVEDYDDIHDGTEIEGLITWVKHDQSSFQLNYQGYFLVDSSTRFEDGNKINLQQGALVEVTSRSQNGQNIAVEVEFEDDNYMDGWPNNDIEFEGLITSTDTLEQKFIIKLLNGTEKDIFVNRNTRYEDGLTFNTMLNRAIEVEVYKVNDQYIASEIELQD